MEMMAAWEYPTYKDYVEAFIAKGLRVIPNVLWMMLKKEAHRDERVWTMADL
jgi:hypothetical protein